MADSLNGTSAPEQLFELGSDDTITAGLRTDASGRGAGIDTAVYQSARENYTITLMNEGGFQVSYSCLTLTI